MSVQASALVLARALALVLALLVLVSAKGPEMSPARVSEPVS